MHACMYVWMYVYVSVYIYAHADAPTHLCLNLRSVTSFTERQALARSRWAAARHGAKPGGPNGPNARSPFPHSRSRHRRSTLGRPLPHRRPLRTACGCVCELAAPCVCARDISTRTLSHCACVRACVPQCTRARCGISSAPRLAASAGQWLRRLGHGPAHIQVRVRVWVGAHVFACECMYVHQQHSSIPRGAQRRPWPRST